MTPVIAHEVCLFAILATAVLRWPHEKQRRCNHIARNHQDWQEKCLISLSFVGMAVLPSVAVLSTWLKFAQSDFHPGLASLGVAVTFVALWLFRRSHADLGRHWSPTLVIHQDQTVVETGVYRRIRHPMYCALFLLAFGQALLFNDNWVTGLAGLVTFGLMYGIRVGREERMMLERFGDRYRAYMSRTKRLIPRVL